MNPSSRIPPLQGIKNRRAPLDGPADDHKAGPGSKKPRVLQADVGRTLQAPSEPAKPAGAAVALARSPGSRSSSSSGGDAASAPDDKAPPPVRPLTPREQQLFDVVLEDPGSFRSLDEADMSYPFCRAVVSQCYASLLEHIPRQHKDYWMFLAACPNQAENTSVLEFIDDGEMIDYRLALAAVTGNGSNLEDLIRLERDDLIDFDLCKAACDARVKHEEPWSHPIGSVPEPHKSALSASAFAENPDVLPYTSRPFYLKKLADDGRLLQHFRKPLAVSEEELVNFYKPPGPAACLAALSSPQGRSKECLDSIPEELAFLKRVIFAPAA